MVFKSDFQTLKLNLRVTPSLAISESSAMARLNDACESFIASLQKAQAELDQVANKLEEEFSKRSKGSTVNPMDVLNRIHRLRNELPVLANECAEVLQAKQECVDVAKVLLAGNCEELARLQRKSGMETDERENEELQAFQGAVVELESKLRLGGNLLSGEEQLNRSALNEAIVHSVVS